MQTMRALQNEARKARMAPMAPLRLRMNAMRSSFSPPRGSMAQATPRAPLGTRGGVRKWFHQSRRSVGVRIQWVEKALPTTTAGSSAPTVAQPAHQAGYLGTVTPPSIPYEQWRAGYDNACEEARRSAAAAAAAASAVASTPTSEVEKSIATYVQAAYGLSSRSAMSAAQKFFRDTQVAEKLRLACMGGR